MRIGLIRMRYTPFGGAEVFLHRFIDGLIKKGHTVDIFATAWIKQSGVTFHKVTVRAPSFLRPLVFARGAASLVDKIKPDVVISLERTYCQEIYRAGDGCHREWLIRKASTMTGLKRSLISLNPLHAVLLSLEKKLFFSKRLKKIVTNSQMVKADIVRHYGLPDDKIAVIYNGVDLPAGFNIKAKENRKRIRAELGISEGAVLLLFVGSGFERKGLMSAVRALGELKTQNDVRLLVIGKGRQARYAAEATRLGVRDKVTFYGPVQTAFDYYSAADVFVLPSIYEPFSNACLEAMAAGLPVITSVYNGVAEIITHPNDSLIVKDPLDAREIASKITMLLDCDMRKKAADAARITAADYTVEKNVNAFLSLIGAG